MSEELTEELISTLPPIVRKMVRPKHILLVDDDLDLSFCFKAVISENLHAKLFVATRVKEAIKMLDESSYDLALLDLKLPDGDGLDIFRHIVVTENPTPVVIFSGFIDEMVRHEISRIGFAIPVEKSMVGSASYVNGMFRALGVFRKTQIQT